MRRPLRLALVVVGLAAVVYGVASLTGGWLGTPPWWERCEPILFFEFVEEIQIDTGPTAEVNTRNPNERQLEAGDTWCQARPGREWYSGGVVAVGLGLIALGAWPRRSKPETTTP